MVTVTVYGDLTTCKLLASMLARRPLVHCSTAFEDCARVFFAHKGLNLFDAKNFLSKSITVFQVKCTEMAIKTQFNCDNGIKKAFIHPSIVLQKLLDVQAH